MTIQENQYQTQQQPDLLADYEKTMLDFAEPREILPHRQKIANFYNQAFDNIAWLKAQGFLVD